MRSYNALSEHNKNHGTLYREKGEYTLKLNHITYSVSDLARSMALFENALGAKRW